MNIWTYLHFSVFLVYVILFIYTIAQNPRAFLNVMAALLFICFAVWSLGNAFLYNTNLNAKQAEIILAWESTGWIFFPVFLLVFILEFTGFKKAARNPFLWGGFLSAGLLLQTMLWQGRILDCCTRVPHGLTSEWMNTIWVYIYHIYCMGTVAAGIIILAYQRKKEKDHNRKRLFEIHLVSIVICFVFAAALSIVLKEFEVYMPFEGTIILLVFAFGIVYSMTKYEFMLITPSRAAERLINTMKDGFILFGGGGRVITANKEAADIFGCGENEIEKEIEENGLLGQDLKRRIKEGREIKNEEYTLEKRGGEKISIVINAAGFIENKEVLGMLCIIKNITEIKKAQQRLKNSEERFEGFIESTSEWIWETDSGGVIMYSGGGIKSILGYEAREVLGRKVSGIMPEAEAERFMKRFMTVRETGVPFSGFVTFAFHKNTGEKVIMESNGVPVYDETGFFKGCRGASRDITGEKTAQENLEKTIEELKRSNVELERFAYVVSHDLKEPLRMVSSYVNLLRKRYREKLDKDADEFIDFAAGGADRMSRLIDDILEYSRVSTRGGEFEKADTGEIVERVLNILKFKIKDSGARIKLEGGFPVILADPRQITQVFQNLIENAIKFSGKDAPVIKISAYRRDDEICFRVSDSGIGIKKEYSRKIFEIFQRLHTADEYEGTGIGLAIVKKIIERHGGEIWVESPGEGLGSVFVFTIPLKK